MACDRAPRGTPGRTPASDLESLAAKLREAAYPGARSWAASYEGVKAVWLKVAELARSRIEREVDKALREATAKAHELGQHAAAKAIREMRMERERGDG